ncbi:MAG: protein kinase [Polyangiaceae bacterium]|nr:protein kinase [Polyangiaceae bacterium]
MLPERLGAFEITGMLGEGGSALVYSAHDGARDVALKVLHEELCVDEKQVERFLAEAERMRSVRHPSLVPVLGAGCLPGGRPFIVMPRLRGRTLAARLVHGPVPFARALSLFEDVAQAVAALHQAGLVHRDIKPENVFWCEPEDVLVLLDLGIARDTFSGPSTTTRAGFQRGTPAYMAPERLFGQPASTASDIYELALLFYMMTTARLPWEEGDALGRVKPALRPQDRHLLPAQLADVLLEAMSFDVTQRPSTVETLMAKIRRATTVFAPTVLAPITPNVPIGLWPSSPPPAHAESAPHDVTIQTPDKVTLRSQDTPAVRPSTTTPASAPRSRTGLFAVATFVLGAGLAAGLALGIPALKSRQAPAAAVGTPSDDSSAAAEATSEPSALPAASLSIASSEAIESASAPSDSASADSSASASASVARFASAGPIKEGTIDPEAVRSRVTARMSAMQACLSTDAAKPDFQGGRVNLRFWIGTNGTVTSATGSSAELSRAVVDCVVGQVKTVSFPTPVGGPVNIIFPIRFKPAQSSSSG